MNATQTTQIKNQTCALAALAQAAVLVHRCANGEACHANFVTTLMNGLMVTQPESPAEAYGSIENLLLGINSAESMLGKPDPALIQPLKYVIELISLEKRLRAQPKVLTRMGEMIATLQPSYSDMGEHLQFTHFAEIYQETIATLGHRIQISGRQEQLEKRPVAEKVRALLLCGIRYAWLWRQLGGRRWHLLTKRSKIRQSLSQLNQLRAIH